MSTHTPATVDGPEPAAESPVAATPPQPSAQREHRFDIDLLRLVGSTAVIFAHVSAAFIAAVEKDESNGAAAYWVGFVADSSVAFAVPLFFAIAGWAVLVGAPPKDSKRVWQRIIRNSVPLFVWSALYIAWARLQGDNDEPVRELAVDALFGSVQPAYHLWFMYAYIVIVAMLAFAVLLRAGQHPIGLALALVGVATLGPVMETVREVTDWTVPAVGWGFSTYPVVYSVCGALLLALPHGIPPRYRWLLAPGMIAAIAGVAWYNTQVHYVIPNAHLFVACQTVCVLLAISRIRIPEHRRPLLSKLANAALGAYMVHVFFVEELVDRVIEADAGLPQTLLTLAGSMLVTLVLSYATSLVWGRLGLRRWLG